MSERCRRDQTMADMREGIIGLGAGSQRKSYYPQLQERISELERANRALAESEMRYKALVENIDVGIFRVSLEDGVRFVQANAAMARILGYSNVEELLSHDPSELCPPLLRRNRIRAQLERDGAIKNMRVVASRKDGRPVSLLVTLIASRFQDSRIEWIDGLVVDVTMRERSQRRIEEDRARLQAIFDSLPVGIILIDSDGLVIGTNRRWRQIWMMDGASEEGRLDRYVGRLAGSKERLKRDEWPIARAFRGESIIDEEIEIQRFDGSPGTLLASAVPIRDLGGGIIGAVSTIIDITSRKRLERDLEEARSRSEMYVDLLTHDISNYNAAAMGYLQLAEDVLQLNEQDRRLIIKPLEELRNSTELLANVWDLQRVESGRERDRPMEVEKILQQVIRDYRVLPGKDVSIALHQECRCRVMATDLLGVVFSNIMSNAIKHSGHEVNVVVRLSSVVRGGQEWARVEVEDDGPGVPDEKKAAIFDRSLMGLTKPISRGLGLYLVKRLVDEYGGVVWVEDRVTGDHTQGARFVVELPALSVDQQDPCD